jgi:uncharacterized protein involved in exopolysaccharide biosynthesis
MEQNTQNLNEESSIDFSQMRQALKKHARLYKILLPAAFLLACFYQLSLHNYYSCTVKLAPELSNKSRSVSLGNLASQFGLNLGTTSAGMDAINPTLYPDLMNSVDFKVSLFPIMIHKRDSTRQMSYYDYLKNEQKSPWWSEAIGSSIKWMISLIAEDKPEEVERIDPFQLTKVQASVVKAINNNVVCDVDKKTLVITINVTDQDPLIAATVADSVQQRLQAFITNYRTSKARVDYEYNKKLFRETKARYEKARRDFAAFADANQDVILESVRSKQADLENEMQLQYNIYTQVAAQLQASEAKVQEDTPAFTTLQSATVPVRKAGPSRGKGVLSFVFLVFLGITVWILHKENQLKPLLGL